ncbi:MAG: ferredoxin [Patescibacteria group bacterium]
MAKITINQNECIGCSFCMNCAPELFKYDEKDFKGKLNENGELVETLLIELTDEQLKKVKEAAEGCPAQAINITEV